MAQEGRLSRKEKKEIRIKRRALRKDLRKRGIKSREEFEIIARQLGLVYGDDDKWLIIPWWIRLGGWLGALGMKALWWALGLGLIGLAAIFTYASLANQKGNFTISVSGNLLNIGFDLSDTEDFAKPTVRLASDILTEVNATSIQDLPDNLDDAEGSHNIENVVAYTYWIRNAGEQTVDVEWYMVLNAVTKGVDDAVWIMIYDEGWQTVYATPVAATGEPEHLSGYHEPPLMEKAASPLEQYYQMPDGSWGIKTTPYLEERIVASGLIEDFEPDERRKYTVVIWVEGDDPECTDEIMGAHAGYAMKYIVANEDRDTIFENLVFDELDPDYIYSTEGATFE